MVGNTPIGDGASYKPTQISVPRLPMQYPALRSDDFFHPLGQSSPYFKRSTSESEYQRGEITTPSDEAENETHAMGGKSGAFNAAASGRKMDLDEIEFSMLVDPNLK